MQPWMTRSAYRCTLGGRTGWESSVYSKMSSGSMSSGERERDSRYRPGSVGWRTLTWPKASSTPSWARMRLASASSSITSVNLSGKISPCNGGFVTIAALLLCHQFKRVEGMDKAAPRRLRFAPSVHRNPGAGGAVQEPFEMETCELVLRLLADMGCESSDRAGVIGLQLGECIQIGLGGGILVSSGP